MDNESRKYFFNHEEGKSVTPENGYMERDVAWFNELMLPDVLKTKERLLLGPSLLDVGCAHGYFTKRYAAHFHSVTGIDYSEVRVGYAKEHNDISNVTYHLVDLITDSIPGVYDDAISSAVFQHIALEGNEREIAFQAVHDVLRSSGRLILYDETFDDRPYHWDGLYEPLSRKWIIENLHGLFSLKTCDYVGQGKHGEHIYRYELIKGNRYSQHGEDAIIERLLGDPQNGFYIDVGANHASGGSVTQYFYNKGWDGITIEPQPNLYEEHRANRPRDIQLNCAVGSGISASGRLFIGRSDGLSTLVPEYATDHPQTIDVPIRTLASICAEHVGYRPIDFVKIDVEGFERGVLLGMDWDTYRPKVLCIESNAPMSDKPTHYDWQYIVLGAGYRLATTDTQNRNRYYIDTQEEDTE